MPATALAAVASFEQILLCKYPVPFFRKVEVTFFQGDNLLHNNDLCASSTLTKNTTFKGLLRMISSDEKAIIKLIRRGIHRIFAIFWHTEIHQLGISRYL